MSVGAGPSQGFLLVYESSHFNRLAIFDRVNVGNSRLVPSFTAFWPDPHVDQNNHLITGDNELLRFAGPLRYASL